MTVARNEEQVKTHRALNDSPPPAPEVEVGGKFHGVLVVLAIVSARCSPCPGVVHLVPDDEIAPKAMPANDAIKLGTLNVPSTFGENLPQVDSPTADIQGIDLSTVIKRPPQLAVFGSIADDSSSVTPTQLRGEKRDCLVNSRRLDRWTSREPWIDFMRAPLRRTTHLDDVLWPCRKSQELPTL